jgi:phosphatidylglycerol:prolipoprotein diacylglycerol transferase
VYPVLFKMGALLVPSYGVAAAVGLLLALALAQRTARMTGVAPAQMWNLCVVSLFAALLGSRLMLIAVNWRDVMRHPAWILSLSAVHHPLVGGAAALVGVVTAWVYARRQRMPMAAAADALAAPVTLGLALEQFGSLLAGSGFGAATSVRWAVTYTHPLASRWSGAPIGVPVHPAQAYSALGWLTISVVILMLLPARQQRGDAAGAALMAGSMVIFITEIWRDWEGRGAVLNGALDGPQIAAALLLLAGALALRERKGGRREASLGSGDAHE